MMIMDRIVKTNLNKSITTTSRENKETVEESIRDKLDSRVVLSMKVNGSMLCVMDKVNNPGLTILAMKANGEKEKLMVTVSSSMLMEIFMKENGLMIKLTGTALTLTPMELNTLDSGEMINNMEQASRPGLIVLSMRETISKERRMVKESLLLRTLLFTAESSK